VASLESPGCPLESTTGLDRRTQISQRRDAKPKCPPQRTQINGLFLRSSGGASIGGARAPPLLQF